MTDVAGREQKTVESARTSGAPHACSFKCEHNTGTVQPQLNRFQNCVLVSTAGASHSAQSHMKMFEVTRA